MARAFFCLRKKMTTIELINFDHQFGCLIARSLLGHKTMASLKEHPLVPQLRGKHVQFSIRLASIEPAHLKNQEGFTASQAWQLESDGQVWGWDWKPGKGLLQEWLWQGIRRELGATSSTNGSFHLSNFNSQQLLWNISNKSVTLLR